MFRRPTAVLYLDSPPVEDTAFPKDFRADDHRKSPGLILQVRRAKERRETALDLAAELNEKLESFPFGCRVDDDPEVAGSRLRDALGPSLPHPNSGDDGSDYEVLGARKVAAEEAGALVFQAPGADLASVSGFSLHYELLPLLVLRASDSPRRRSFTLFHELAHLGLRQGGLCDLHDEGVEWFCNRVAAAALMPSSAVHAALAAHRVSHVPTFAQLSNVARSFSVSEQALLLRLVTVGVVPLDTYMARRGAFQRKEADLARSESGGGGTHRVVVLSQNGERFSRLVLEAFQRGVLTGHRAATHLRTSVNGLDQLASDLARRAVRRAS